MGLPEKGLANLDDISGYVTAFRSMKSGIGTRWADRFSHLENKEVPGDIRNGCPEICCTNWLIELAIIRLSGPQSANEYAPKHVRDIATTWRGRLVKFSVKVGGCPEGTFLILFFAEKDTTHTYQDEPEHRSQLTA